MYGNKEMIFTSLEKAFQITNDVNTGKSFNLSQLQLDADFIEYAFKKEQINFEENYSKMQKRHLEFLNVLLNKKESSFASTANSDFLSSLLVLEDKSIFSWHSPEKEKEAESLILVSQPQKESIIAESKANSQNKFTKEQKNNLKANQEISVIQNHKKNSLLEKKVKFFYYFLPYIFIYKLYLKLMLFLNTFKFEVNIKK